MEAKYIVAIVVLGVFLMIMFVSVVILERGHIKDVKLRTWIREQYSSEDVRKHDYDSEEDSEEIPEQETETAAEEPLEAVEEDVEEEPPEEVYGKIDVEGIEEITGNYNGDK